MIEDEPSSTHFERIGVFLDKMLHKEGRISSTVYGYGLVIAIIWNEVYHN